MSVRLNKAIRELNIGLQTAVEFLEKKPNLGEVKPEMSFKLSDAQYSALVEAFKKDKEVKVDANKLFPKKSKEKEKRKSEHRAKPKAESAKHQKYTPLGKIDLDSIGKPAPKQEKPEKPVEEKKETAVPVEKPVGQPENKPKAEEKVLPKTETKTVEEPKHNETPKQHKIAQPEQKKHDKHHAEKEQPKVEQPIVAEPENKKEEREEGGIFTLKSEKKLAPQVKVLGSINLDEINQSTRPKKKTKEEKRREREEKVAQAKPQNGEKKKRQRITKERVDIDAAARQASQQQSGGGKGQQGGGNKQQQGAGKKKKRNRPQKPLEVNEEDVARQVKETLARLTSKTQNKKGAKYRKEKRDAVQEKIDAQKAEARAESKVLKLTEFVTVSELATMMDVGVNQVIGTCMSIGIMVSINQRLDAETINIVAEEFGFKTEYVSAEVQEAITEEVDDENDLVSRAPIVTVMGHVDHGKTSLLDYIRKANVIAGEAGGITQHIGAYSVTLSDGREITFLDTPGHEAFTAMRARGAQVTDIAIIIISADDSVMPTTKEAIAHAQAANVPMVFAINKIDKPGANPDKIREDLANMNLLVEEWGGKYQCQEISAKKGIGVDELLEKVLLEAEMLDLKANPNRNASGSIIESSLDKGRGYVSTVLVSNGTLKIGDVVLAGTSYGRI